MRTHLLVIIILGMSLLLLADVPIHLHAQQQEESLKQQIGRIVVSPGRGPSMAVLEFLAAGSTNATLPAQFSSTLYADLEFSGVVNIIGRSLYPKHSVPDPAQVNFDEWGREPAKADYLVFGNSLTSPTEFVAEVYLYDVQAKNKLLASRYRASSDQVRLTAHQVADEIVKLLSGSDGVATSRIAYVSRSGAIREISTMDYDGFNQQQVTRDGALAFLPSLSRGGERLAYLSLKSGKSSIDIRSMADRSLITALSFSRGTVSSPAFSPDGQSLAFASSKDSNSYQIYVADLSTRRGRQLTNTASVIHTAPRWNPRTSREIAFISDRSGTPQIYIMDAEGSNVRRVLTQGGNADSPAWSPDGRYLAFAWRPPGASRFNIYLMDIASQQIIELTQNAGNNEGPAWSPDGRHIAFQSDRSGQNQIYLMHVDGTGVRPVTSRGGTMPAWFK